MPRPDQVLARVAHRGPAAHVLPPGGRPALDPPGPLAGVTASAAPPPSALPPTARIAVPASAGDAHRDRPAGEDRSDRQGAAGPSAGAVTVPRADGLAIRVGLVTAVDDTTAINFAVTNRGPRPLGLLIIRCNALDASGAASGQAFDALHDVDAGETVYGQALFLKQAIAPHGSFACRDEGLVK